jgi:rubrerythrin
MAKVFKKILVEEAQHNNHHYKLMKKIKDKIEIDLSLIVDTCRDYRHFGLEFVKREFAIADANTKKDHYILDLIYNSQFHREFNQLAIKKYYQLIKILYPAISLDDFTVMVNHNDGPWSRLPLAIDN